MDPRALNVLLVIADAQDEADIRQKLAGARNTLFAVHAVTSLAQAFKLISDKPFDTFLIDLAVPDSDGVSGLQRLVAAARYAPVIIITSAYDESQALEVVRAGADDSVVKSRMNAAAFERVLCYAIERHGVRRQTDLQPAVSRVLAESQNLSEACDGILRVLCESLKFDLGEIWRTADEPLRDPRTLARGGGRYAVTDRLRHPSRRHTRQAVQRRNPRKVRTGHGRSHAHRRGAMSF